MRGNRAGWWRRNLSGDMAYLSFVPVDLPPEPGIALSDDMSALLVKAHRQLALLEGEARHIVDMRQFMAMYVRKEALMSSQIEGTQATLEDILDPAVHSNLNRNVADVVNYIAAYEYALDRMTALPLCNRLIREVQARLMQGVRGQEKAAGEFRHSQNWIGGQGSTLQNAVYIPPNPQDMQEAMDALERYMHSDTDFDPLIQAALIHYQFETIHPFLDGNGRVGRLLILLYLMEKKFISSPVLYISYYLKMQRSEYYDRLMAVRRQGHYEQWVQFFLRAVYESARDAGKTIEALVSLRERNQARIRGMGRTAPFLLQLLSHMEAQPILDTGGAATALGVAYNTASAAIRRMAQAGILVETSQQKRNRQYHYAAYLDILRGGTQ